MLAYIQVPGEINKLLWDVRNLFRHARQLDNIDAAQNIADPLTRLLIPFLENQIAEDCTQALISNFQSLLDRNDLAKVHQTIQNADQAWLLIEKQIQYLKKPDLSEEARLMTFADIGKIVREANDPAKGPMITLKSLSHQASAKHGGDPKIFKDLFKHSHQLYRKLGHDLGTKYKSYQFKDIYQFRLTLAEQSLKELLITDTPVPSVAYHA